MNWAFLKDEGYEILLTKRKWKLYYNFRRMALIDKPRLIAIGMRKKSWPTTLIHEKALPFAIADFVKHRVEGEQERPKIDLGTIRADVQKHLAAWMAKNMDNIAYDLLVKNYGRCPKT